MGLNPVDAAQTKKYYFYIMARYIGPKSKIARRFGEPIFGADKVLSRRNFPPGQHGNNRRRKQSEYAVMLAEKQKAKYTYGVLERQFRILFEKAAKAEGITVRCCFSCWRAVLTTSCSVWVLHLPVLLHVSW